MTLSMPLRISLVRLRRGRCSDCDKRRVLFSIQVEHEPLDDGARSLVGLAAEPRCAECAGLRADD